MLTREVLVETKQAVTWALQQKAIVDSVEIQVTPNSTQALVDMVGEYFNTNKIVYGTFSYDDLLPYLN